MGLWVRDTALKLRQAGIELTKRALTHTQSTAVYKSSTNNSTWKMDVKGNQEGLEWLL
jgi:hypothetical protein